MTDFVIRPFAFMRLTHEALRDGFSKVRQAVESTDLPSARAEFEALRATIALHARQEDECFFPLLDRLFDGVVQKASLRDAHTREAGYERAFEDALGDEDLAEIGRALGRWTESFEKHLVDEEELMMPLTEKVAPTLEGRAAAVREIMEVDWDELKATQLPYVLRSLSSTKPYGPVRTYVAALQVAMSDRYGELEEIIRSCVPAETSKMLTEHKHLS